MEIRKAIINDVPKMVELTMQLRKIENSFSERVSCSKKTERFFYEVFEKHLFDKDYFYFVVEDKEIIGLAFGWKENIFPVYKNDFVGYIADVIVDEKHRGKGIGKKLVTALELEFKKMGLKETKLLVLKDNVDSRKVWEKLGYSDLYIEMRKDL